VRIGDRWAVRPSAVDPDAGTQGLVVKSTKTDAGTRTLVLPRWCVAMLRDRADSLNVTSDDRAGRPVFPAPLGGWRDPSNTQADLRDASTAAGFNWVTTHVFRKTVATLMDQAGLSSRAAADQLGHANTSMTTDVYFGRKVATTGAAAVLEALDT
jgi:integrase